MNDWQFQKLIGDAIRKHRYKAELSRPQVAEHLNVTEQTIKNWENGYKWPSMTTLLKLSQLFGCSPKELMPST